MLKHLDQSKKIALVLVVGQTQPNCLQLKECFRIHDKLFRSALELKSNKNPFRYEILPKVLLHKTQHKKSQ